MQAWLLIVLFIVFPLPAVAQTGACDVVGEPYNDLLGAGLAAETDEAASDVGPPSPERMCGLGGNDTYDYDDPGDFAVERPNEGIDTITYHIKPLGPLPPHVERGILKEGVLAAQGNELDNELIGNAADNQLEGAEGNDILHAGTGDDVLIGGEGEDIAVLTYMRSECEFNKNECRDWAATCIQRSGDDVSQQKEIVNTVRATGLEIIHMNDCKGKAMDVISGAACD